MTLIPIATNEEEMRPYLNHDFIKEAFKAWQGAYAKWGFSAPWIGYLALRGDEVVGLAGYKGPPLNNTVEIAYGTVPEHEGTGVATEICKILVKIALRQTPALRITARTLPKESASTKILRGNKFINQGTVDDPEDGKVWEWLYTDD